MIKEGKDEMCHKCATFQFKYIFAFKFKYKYRCKYVSAYDVVAQEFKSGGRHDEFEFDQSQET